MKQLTLAACMIFSYGIASAQVMTNATIQAMLYGGVPLSTIVRTIKSALRIDLYINKEEYSHLIAAGASANAADQIMQAIHDREYGGAERLPAATPASIPAASTPAPAPSTQPTVTGSNLIPAIPAPPSAPVAIEIKATSGQPPHTFIPLRARADGKSRIFVGESELFYSSSFSTSSFSAASTITRAKASGLGFGFSSAGILKFTVQIMKTLNDKCADRMIVVNSPELADYFLRLDTQGRFILSRDMVAFARSGEMSFVATTKSMKKDIERFCLSLPQHQGADPLTASNSR